MLFTEEDLNKSFSLILTYKFKMLIIEIRGRSSGVERNLAKVEVEGSNPFARSNKPHKLSLLSVKFLSKLINFKSLL